MSNTHSASIEARLETPGSTCVLTYERLNTEAIIGSVGDDASGATAVFIGTTRNSFKGKVVTKLEYQAYSKLAVRTMLDIINQARLSTTHSSHHPTSESVQSLIHCVIYHRLGTVPVGEPSIVIAVSSPHRREAFAACEQILEGVKARAQIWKREFYEGESSEEAEWKTNV
ncbi:hypothetical protein HETIRDRAFT_306753 [Heterobasidion irregulare TC 32-1]|uniref:Molybdenum cofactor synthesis 2 n=1 Tax=Heterobasidion irregulare (strain TC 32-1) TaxID=747525 RepID=W4KM18_HETIT|nr:uncharacterized protein HETIRDRAFT_306753 [Heterobasidion irregulare TC 32-1]ETW86878.1 hypothetical protein HETIRDRAFT_306753 [Heterobasidion irregulare TC 32-1]